jgi:hypothetical protein
VTSQGSAAARFARAITTGNLMIVRAAAAELGALTLDQALAVLLVIASGEPDRYARAAARWAGRYALETRGCELTDLAVVLAALRCLVDPDRRELGVETLTALFDARGHDDLSAQVERWHRK